ncbi:MAG: MAPEG family protein [Pseudomonadota bacterium]|nr:MAPEG family protein [Pseudomonadota bacterium]
MSIALWGLVGLALLVLIYVSVDSFLLKGSVGNGWTVGARDTPPEIGPVAARAHRALWNLLETAPAFLAVALVAELTAPGGAWVTWGVLLYLGARVAYLPAYLSGIPWVRTVFWQIATLGIVLILVGVVIG